MNKNVGNCFTQPSELPQTASTFNLQGHLIFLIPSCGLKMGQRVAQLGMEMSNVRFPIQVETQAGSESLPTPQPSSSEYLECFPKLPEAFPARPSCLPSTAKAFEMFAF